MSLLERPEPAALLEGVASFLEEEVRPALAGDRGLAYRCLVAASLCRSLAAEHRAPSGPAPEPAGQETWAGVEARLAARLRAINPRFDLSRELP